MKKTVLLAGALIAIIAVASVFYNSYQDNNPSGQDSSEMHSEISDKQEEEQQDHSETNDSEQNTENNVIPAMDFTVYEQDGGAINLSKFYGKPIVVNFWATWCGPCKSELPAFETLYQEYGEDISFMMVNLTDGAQETVGGVTEFVMNNNYHFPVYFDTGMDAAMTYSVYSIPATLFIDADGNIVASHLGMMSEDTLRNYIENLLIAE